MRNLNQVRWVLLLAIILLGLNGCGDDDHDDSHTGAGTAGIVADPYIVGATFFADLNDNGFYDDGEPVSGPSDENGRFVFAETVASDSVLVMLETGEHQGLPFTLRLRRPVGAGDVEPLVVSPLTTLLSAGFEPAELLALLAQTGMPGAELLSVDALSADPMAGLQELTADMVTAGDLALLRANFAAYGVLEYLNTYGSGIPDRPAIESALNAEGFTGTLFNAVAYLCSPETLADADSQLPAGLPAMTMADLAETIPAILYWWTGQFYSDLVAEKDSFPTIEEMAPQLDAFVRALAPYAYALNRRGDETVDPEEFLSADLLPLTEDTYFMLANRSDVVEVRPVAREVQLTTESFEDVAYVLMGEVMHFYADGTWEGLAGFDGTVERATGTWSVAGNDLLITDDADGQTYSLTLVAEWNSYLRFMTTDPVVEGQPAGVVNLLLANLLNLGVKDIEGQGFALDDGQCDAALCGGRLHFGAYDDLTGTGVATLVDYTTSTIPISATWHLDDFGAIVVETADETNELYFYNEQGSVVVVTRDGQGAVTDVAAEHIYHLDTLDAIRTGTFSVSSSPGEELVLREDHVFTWTDGVGSQTGTWSYNSLAGNLNLIVAGDVAVHLWFYQVEGPAAEELPFFYEEFENGVLVESGFDRLTYAGPAPAPPVNLALNKPVTPVTNTVQGAPANVVDGDPGTLWYSWQGVESDCIFVLDLEADTEVARIDIRFAQTDDYLIESSLNGTDWTLLYQDSGLWQTVFETSVPFDPSIQARYLRYTGSNQENAYVGLTEFQVFGP